MSKTERDEESKSNSKSKSIEADRTGGSSRSGISTGSTRQRSETAVDGETDERVRDEWTDYEFEGEPAISVRDLDVFYGDEQALQSISMAIPKESVTALVGPSGCGKSTFLRCLNRMNDRISAARVEGTVSFHGENIYGADVNLVELRKRIGMVFQQPNPFPKSIRDNIAYGPRKHGDLDTSLLARLLGRDDRDDQEELVEECLRSAALWDEVSGRLDDNALGLSGGQQQRLCIARALSVSPEVVLMDEPASALDPIATAKIEDLVADLAEDYTIVIVTHNMQQAARISDQTAVFLTGGELVEYGATDRIFENPHSQRVEDYISGKFG